METRTIRFWPAESGAHINPQSGFRNWKRSSVDAVTPMTETRTDQRCLERRNVCPFWTVSTGSSPSTRRRLASVPPTPSLFIKQPFAWRALASSRIEVGFVEMLEKARKRRKGEMWSSGVSRMADRPRAIKIHRIRPGDLKNAPRFPMILPKVKTSLEARRSWPALTGANLRGHSPRP